MEIKKQSGAYIRSWLAKILLYLVRRKVEKKGEEDFGDIYHM